MMSKNNITKVRIRNPKKPQLDFGSLERPNCWRGLEHELRGKVNRFTKIRNHLIGIILFKDSKMLTTTTYIDK